MRQIITHPVTLCLAACVGVFLYFSLEHSAQKAMHSSAFVQTLEQDRDALAAEVRELEQKHAYVLTPLAQEKILRNELLRQRPDEVVVTLRSTADANQLDTTVTDSEKTVWQQWKALLFN